MEVSFIHANPSSGNESYVLRFTETAHHKSPCLLVDSGEGVDLDSILKEDDYLLGILLTHAHTDHYCTLGRNLRDGANVYAASDTAQILEHVLDEGSRHQKLKNISQVLNSLVPVNRWENLLKNVRVRSIPSGHCPGASGFIIQFKSDGDWKTIVATGDFTLNRSAGYPAFPKDMMLDVGAMFLTGASSTKNERDEMFQTAIERANAGSTTLLTATGLASVECAYILGHLIEESDTSIPVRLVGHPAKLYNELSYAVPNVQSIVNFNSTTDVMESGGITIAGPQVPTEGASGRLFGSIRENPNAAVIQLIDGSEPAITNGRCTIRSFDYTPHPTDDEIDSVVNSISPTEVIITHQTESRASRFRDKYASYVWATSDDEWYSLFQNSSWQSPPWMTSDGEYFVNRTSNSSRMKDSVIGDIPLPSIERHNDVDLAAEGLNHNSYDQITRKKGSSVTQNSIVTQSTPEHKAKSTHQEDSAPQNAHVSDETERLVESDVALQSMNEEVQSNEKILGKVEVAKATSGSTYLRLISLEEDSIELESDAEYYISLSKEPFK